MRTRLYTLLMIVAMIFTVAVAQAQDTASFLLGEAGITAYSNVGQMINLNIAERAYRTVENQTETFIVGSVAVPDYPETEDVHVYMSVDGWMAAYYAASDRVSKIIDWLHYDGSTINSTKLELALLEVANAVNVSITEGEHSVILTPHREAFYNREKLVNHPVGKDSPWDKLRFSRYPRFVQENNGTTCAKTSISALTSGLMTSKHVCLTRQAPYPRSATWCGSYAKTSRAVSLKRCSTMLTHRSTTERRPLVPSVSGASRLALP